VAERCGFCGSASGPFTRIEGLFAVLICPGCLACQARGRSPLSGVDNALGTGLDLLPTWAQKQKAAANRQIIAVLGGRLERGMPVVPIYGPLEPGLPATTGRDR
jgi:hypothetical protein